MEIRRILVSQPKPENGKSPYYDLGEKYNFEVEFRQFIAVEGVSLKEFRKSHINILDFGAVLFTSKTAIDNYFRLLEEQKLVAPVTMKYFCLTESIALYLQKYIVYRKRKIFFGNGDVEDMQDIIMKNKQENFLFPVADIHKPDVPKKLEKLKINFTKAVFYKTVCADLSDIKELNYDMLVFFTPIGVESLLVNFPNFQQNDIAIAAFGPVTHKAVKKVGLRLDIKAPTEEITSMTMAIEQFIKENLNKDKKND